MRAFRNLATRVALPALIAAGLAAGTGPARAQDYPSKAVRITTPFPAGAGPETVARVVAEKLAKAWGKGVVVENRPGGNGFIAIDAFKRGDKNGYDLIQLDNVHLTAYPSLFKRLPYDPQNDFELIAPLFKAAFFFTVPSNSPYQSVADLVADAKKKPGQLNYGSWSVGNPVHLGSALFESLTGTKFEHVIYKETAQLYAGVANGELAFALGSSATSGPVQRTGRLRYLAVAGPKRIAAFPDVPTVGESGGPKDFEVLGWTVLAAPKGLDPAIVAKIRQDVEKALAEPDIAEKFASFGYERYTPTQAEFAAFVASDARRFGDVIRRAKVSLD